MTESDQQAVSRRGPLTAITFYFVCLLLFPAILVGYVLWISKTYAGRTSGVSGTAQGPLSARWFQHRLGTRRDEPAHRLLMVLPGVSPLAVRLVFGPMLLAHRLSGYVPRAFRYPFEGDVSLQNQASARQTFYDSVVDRYLADVAQVVILGAGFDTRAFRLPKETRVRSFEVDTLKTLTLKQEVLKKAGVNPAEVTFVAADFEKKDWLSRLVEAGFDVDKPTLFLWEGVTPYLDRAAVEDTLRKIAGTAQGSILAFDYLTTEVLESRSLYLRTVRASLRAGGEPLKFGIDSTPPSSERLAELLRSCGLSPGEQHTFGQELDEKRAWGGFATAIVQE
ncbi:SAM-dependent methyltransferase [Archangium sp.]|jgi:methyltransferase (TIGR00027 family)|uniref:class I SAM-dependent methyltransferase n=1 Tax=Archangium sp. TaxID=1872627 RepID=UPI002EDAE1A2